MCAPRNQALEKKKGIVHENLVNNSNKQSSRDKQELATLKCKYDELNAAFQQLKETNYNAHKSIALRHQYDALDAKYRI